MFCTNQPVVVLPCRKRAHDCLVKYLLTFQDEDANTLKSVYHQARTAVVEALQLPDIFEFDQLIVLPAVRQLEHDLAFLLLQFFIQGSLHGYMQFHERHASDIQALGLSHNDLLKKLRLMAMAQLASVHLMGVVSFRQIALALEIQESEAEHWAIDAIRARLIDARIDQLNRNIMIM